MAKKTYVLDLSSGKWTTFSGLDIISNCILSGGERLDNVNLFLDSQGNTKMYPDDENANRTSEEASIEKKIETYYSTFRNISIDYIDKLTGDATGTITATVKNKIRNFDKVNNITVTSEDNVSKRHGLPLGNYGEIINILIKNFDKVKNILLTFNSHKTKR